MILFLYGQDTFRSRKKLKEIKEKFLQEVDPSGINLHILNAEKIDLREIETALLSSPFLAKKRMVIIERFFSQKPPEKTQKRLLDILNKKAVKETIVVFWEETIDTKKSENHPLLKKLLSEKYAFAFHPLNENDVQKWIQKRIQELGGSISSRAAILLSSIVGNDLWLANTEIEKLVSYCSDRSISERDISTLCQNKIEENIFLFTDALGRREIQLALRLLSEQLSAGTTLIEIFYKMVWQFKNLLTIKSIIESSRNFSPSSISQETGMNFFVVKKTLQQARLFHLKELISLYQALLKIEEKIKTGYRHPEIFFDLLIVAIGENVSSSATSSARPYSS